MTRTIVLLLAVTLAIANAHTYLSSVTVGGVDQGERNCLRPLYGGNAPGMFRDSPIMDVKLLTSGLSSDNMTCGFLPYAAGPANRKCAVAAGSKMGLTWRHNGNTATDDIIESSHVGPCFVYMARSETGSGAVWFKVFEEGYNNGQWCSMRVKAARGYMEFTIPSTLPGGNYLVRGEIIALHDGDKPNGAQPYVSCAEITLTSSGSITPPSSYMVDMTSAYKLTDPGIRFNIYNSYSSYPIPGPKLYSDAVADTTATTQTTATTTTTTTTTQPTTTTTQATTTTTTTTTQQTSQPTQQTSQQPTQTNNGCGTEVSSQCIQLCGTRGVSRCACVSGQPQIECGNGAESSSASTLKPFWFL